MSRKLLVAVPILAMLLVGCSDGRTDEQTGAIEEFWTVRNLPAKLDVTSTAIPTTTPTRPPTATPTPTAEPTPTPTASPTATPTPTAEPTSTPTASPTATPTPTAEPTPIPTATPTPLPTALSPPPRWIFTEDVPEGIGAIYREEMERVRGFFSDRFGYEATDFVVLVGSPDALEESVYQDVTGEPPPRFWTFGGHVLTGRDGVTFAVFEYYPGPIEWNTIAHEYIHVLQYQLAGWGGSRVEGVDLGSYDEVRVSSFAPRWQVEGFAVYGDYLYLATRPERPPFIPYTLAPYRYLQCNPQGWDDPELELRRQERACEFYDLAFLASIFLMEELPVLEGLSVDEGAWLNYWKLLAEAEAYWMSERVADNEFVTRFVVDWQPAFQKAFGISVDDFYVAFGEWARSDVIDERADTRVDYGGCP